MVEQWFAKAKDTFIDFSPLQIFYALVVQWTRTLRYERKSWEFDSLQG